MEIKKQTNLRGELTVPGDKSISHRAVMFGSLAQGTTKITHFLEGADCLSTISCFRKMGIDIERNAVSYTHLDVYKRQDEIWAEFPSYTQYEVRSALAKCGLTTKHIESQVRVLSGGEQAKVRLCKLCLLYTSYIL